MPINPIKQFPKESAAFSVAWGDSPAARNVIITGNERNRPTNVCEFTAVWGSPAWGTFLTEDPGCSRADLLQTDACI